MQYRNTLASFALAATLGLGGGMMVGCDDDPDTAGEAVERAGEKAEDAAEKAADKIEDAAENTKDAVKDATN